ncbi:hypothetical protein IA69_03150 [Massilia sp. JS1662]|nr:hypothetical protein [Massilia sp. JS1662]KGF83220.1 hypothetical protein IA69_03150 [Massilia sp. JS1662]
MPAFPLSLLDLVSPYQLLGTTLGDWQAALGAIYVDHYEATGAGEGTTIRGMAKFAVSARPVLDLPNARLTVEATAGGLHPQDDPTRRDPWIDIQDTQIAFELFVPRTGSPIIAAATGVPATTTDVFNVIDTLPIDMPVSDYPGAQFTLDMLLTTVVLRPPMLKGAKLRESDGLLERDPANTVVSFTLPKLRMQLSQDAAGVLAFNLLSLGASSLDDGSDLGTAELITMTPPYAFIGDSNVVGFGFRSAVLDLSNGYTPPEVLAQFGYDENWTGLYLPVVRLFVAPHGMNDIAVSAGASNLLIGLGNTPGITGDFDVSVINQGAPIGVSVRFYGPGNQPIGITRTGDTATAMLPQQTRMVVDASGQRPPYTFTATLDGSPLAPVAPSMPNVFDVDLGTDGAGSIVVGAASGGGAPAQLTIAAGPRTGSTKPGTPVVAEAQFNTDSITRDGTPVGAPPFRLKARNNSSITITLDPPNPATAWKVRKPPAAPAVSKPTGEECTIELGPNESAEVEATTPDVGAGPETVTAYFRFDRPTNQQLPEHDPTTGIDYVAGLPGTVGPTPTADVTKPSNSSTGPAATDAPESPFTGSPVGSTYAARLDRVPAGSTIEITGWASNEDDPNDVDYNFLLSRRRAEAFAHIIRAAAPGKNFNFTLLGRGPVGSSDLDTRRTNWRAEARLPAAPLSGTVTKGTVSRGDTTVPQIPDNTPDPAPTQPTPPSWFRALGAKVRIVRDEFVAVEVFGEFDINTPSEQFIQQNGGDPGMEPVLRGMGSNPMDGVIKARIVFQIDNATGDWSALAYLGADPADKDGLVMTGQLPGQPLLAEGNFGRNLLGMTALFAPLLDAAAPANPASGDMVPAVLAVGGVALATGLAQAGYFNVERVVLWGGEIAVRKRANGTEVAILGDIETAVSANVEIGGITLLTIPRKSPLSVRYKAIGMRFGNTPGERDFQFRPVFDSSRGYSIDLTSGGGITVPDPLGQFIKILGARVARTNPLSFEFDLGLNADLGVVTFDRARVRLKFAEEGGVAGVELTAFGAGVNIPGVLVGKGSFELGEEVGGAIDLQLVPIDTRVRAVLKVTHVGGRTGVFVALELELPVAIPLGGSGLGIYGFLGMFAMHYARDEDGLTGPTIALDWLKNRADGNPTNPDAWKGNPDHWAFGVGATIGTMGSSVVFNLKGVFMLELPGPRILLMMKARLLQPMPALKDKNAEGNLLAVIDLDAGRGTLTIGIVADYTIDPLIKIRVPIEAFFNLKKGEDWHLYLGQRSDPIQCTILSVIDASGYLMLSGNGLPAYPDAGLPQVYGFAIGTGLRAAFTWGSVPARLYLRIGAGFDAVLGFDPFRLAGRLYVRGELVLFILSISAYAELDVDVGENVLPDGRRERISKIDGEICGEVDLFFFTIKGCVDFHLGATNVPKLPAPPLVRDLKLVSRSPALVMGTGTDRPVDGAIGTATEGGVTDKTPVVPIDAIPVLMLSVPPVDDGLTVFGSAPLNHPGAAENGWQQQGKNWVRYEITKVELVGAIGDGDKPSVWWTLKNPIDPASAQLEVQLALLAWTPNATPKAFTRSEYQEETIRERWGTVCHKAAPATSVLWTFRYEQLGPSKDGWIVDGEAWPDPPDTVRSRPPVTTLEVTECWRCGIDLVDRKRGIDPAFVTGTPAPCPRETTPTPTPTPQPVPGTVDPTTGTPRRAVRAQVAQVAGIKRIDTLPAARLTWAATAARLQAGQPLSRAELATSAVHLAAAATSPTEPQRCEAKVLASPLNDDGRVIALGNPADEKAVKQAWEALGFRPPELFNGIVLHSGEVAAGRLLLFVLSTLVRKENVLVRQRAKDGTLLAEQAVTLADVVPTKPVPAEWMSAAGPWRDDVQLAAGYLAALGGTTSTQGNKAYLPVIVEIKGADKVHTTEIGQSMRDPIRPEEQRLLMRPYYLAVAEFMHAEEIARHDWDETTTTRNHGAVEAALSDDACGHALLAPDTAYQVKVEWKVQTSDQDTRPTAAETDDIDATTESRVYHFRTDDEAPKKLDPWVLMTLPEEGESHVFGQEPLSFVFATNDVSQLYAAYGKKLQVRIKAASFRRPVSTPSVPHPFPINADTLDDVKGGLLSPWEESVREVLQEDGGKPCVDFEDEAVRHSKVTVPIPLDPYTDYVVDIEAVDADAPENTVGDRVLRRSFSTSAYGTLGEFANTFLGTRPEHRYVEAGRIATLSSTFASHAPQGSELDEAMIAAGLGPMGTPTAPRVVALWEQPDPAQPPQPVAVIVDSPEPLHRTRLVPTKVTDPVPSAPERYEMLPTTWLQLAQMPDTPDLIQRVIPAPGGQRAIVILKPGSRGANGLALGLKRERFADKPYLFDATWPADPVKITYVSLLSAPWEEQA